MILFPAVDIKDGSAVRLKQGQADKKTGDGAVCPIPRQDVPLPLRVAEGRRCAITS